MSQCATCKTETVVLFRSMKGQAATEWECKDCFHKNVVEPSKKPRVVDVEKTNETK